MKNVYSYIFSTTLLLLSFVTTASAEGLIGGDPSGGRVGTLLQTLLDFSETRLIPFILGIGFLVFVWGMFQYFILGGSNDEAKEKGKSLVIYAVAGFVLVLAFWGIINLISNGIGGTGETITPPKVNVK